MTSVSTDRRQGVNAGAAVKVPVKTATLANITLNGLQTIDGVVLAESDRVLVKSQTTQSENGIYVADSGNWTRDVDADGAFDFKEGTFVYVTDGATTIGFWYITTSDPITIGTTNLVFARASSVLAVVSAFVQTLLPAANAAAFLTLLGVSAYIQTLLDDPDAATARATLGITDPTQEFLYQRYGAI